jgi:hypothetical protein
MFLSTPRVRPDVASATRSTQTVLLDLRRARYYQLNKVAGRIWALLCEGASVAQIVGLLTEEFDAPVDVISRDTCEVIDAFGRAGLIEGLVASH